MSGEPSRLVAFDATILWRGTSGFPGMLAGPL